MKGSKILLASLMVAMGLMLTGCGSNSSATKTLDCSTSSSGVEAQLKLGYEGKKVVDFKVNYYMDLSEYSDVQIEALKGQDFCSVVSAAFGEYRMGFSGCKQDITNKKLTVNSNIDLGKLDSSIVNGLSDINSSKAGFEASGYTCTIK